MMSIIPTILTDREALSLFQPWFPRSRRDSLPPFTLEHLVEKKLISERCLPTTGGALLEFADGSVLYLHPYTLNGKPHIGAYYYTEKLLRYAKGFETCVD